jgi:protease PrsW
MDAGVLKAAIALAPVLALLFLLDRLDVFNLITMREICALLGAGAALAAFGLLLNGALISALRSDFTAYSRLVGPAVEEALKAAPILFLYMHNRLGFKLDAAIAGFAVGAGFSVTENIWYLFTLVDANMSAWLVRGLGTAIMHAGATALFAVISHEMTERQAEGASAGYRFNALAFAPGLAAATAAHATFNLLPGQPTLAMLATLLLIPLTLFLTLVRSEAATRRWLQTDEAAHRRLLAEIRADHFLDTEIGRSVGAVITKLPQACAADALAYVERKIELVLRAEELLIAAHSDENVEILASDREKFAALDALEAKVGKALTAALDARIGLSRNDVWELGQLRRRCAAIAPPAPSAEV